MREKVEDIIDKKADEIANRIIAGEKVIIRTARCNGKSYMTMKILNKVNEKVTNYKKFTK